MVLCFSVFSNVFAYSITYNLNGGSWPSPARYPNSYTASSLPLDFSGCTNSTTCYTPPVRTGYTFLRWYWTTSAGSNYCLRNKTYNGQFGLKEGEGVLFPCIALVNGSIYGNLTAKAEWSMDTYTITYVLDDNTTNNSANPTSYDVTTSPITLKKPTKQYYSFNGWYKNRTCVASGTLPNVTLTCTYSNQVTKVPSSTGSTGDITLYPKFTHNSITYYLNGGTNASNNPSQYDSNTSTLLEIPTKTGYTFAGWCTNEALTQSCEISKGILSGTTGPLKFYAKWNPMVTTVTLSKQNGSGGTDTIYQKYNTGWYTNSGATTSLVSVSKPTRTGYDFGGYYTGTNGTGTQIILSDGTLKGNASTTEFSGARGTLYAK